MDKLPTPIELIEKVMGDLKKVELHEGEKEHLTEVASNLTDFYHQVEKRVKKEQAAKGVNP